MGKALHIVFLDVDTIGRDIDLSAFYDLGTVTLYGYTAGPDVQERALDADVLDAEPMEPGNPLAEISDSTRLIITPHIAWASVEARTRLMRIVSEQVREFFENA